VPVIKGFTGISDPYEEPTNAELRIDTTKLTPLEAAQKVIDYLSSEGYLKHPETEVIETDLVEFR